MNKYMIMAVAMPMLALAACTNEEGVDKGEKTAASVYAAIGSQTRAHDTEWEAGDAIGIICNGTDTKYFNMKYVTADGDGNFAHEDGAAAGIFFQSPEEVTFYAYYPHFEDENEDYISQTIDVSAQANQKTFDFLFASGAVASRANPTVSFKDEAAFKHLMTRLVINITTDPQSGFTVSDVKNGTYTLGELYLRGLFSFDKTYLASVAYSHGSEGLLTLDTPNEDDNTHTRTYDLILLPKDNTDPLTFTAVIADQTYTCQINPALAAGTKYTYDIVVKKTGLQVMGSKIADWTEGTGGSGTATMTETTPGTQPE